MIKKINITFIFIIILLLFTMNIFASVEFGDKSTQVKEIQQMLNNLGYDVSIDGIYGYRTKENIKDFQRSNGLTADGIVGDKTFNFLIERTKDIEYVVKKGDSLSELAVKFNSTLAIIREKNQLSSNKIIAGKSILIPKSGMGDGRIENVYKKIDHKIQAGDALSILAKKYGSSVQAIKRANNLRDNQILVGQTLTVPHLSKGVDRVFALNINSLIWPVKGRISSPYGNRIHPITGKRQFHGGIDIAVPTGTQIRAAADGKVIKSGWVNGFGYTIVIDHGKRVRTLYGHNTRLLVKSGSVVKKEDRIALSGSTGESTGPHLDFRIYLNGETVSPLNYLP